MKRERPVEARDRLGLMSQGVEGDAAIAMGLGVIRPQCDGAVEALEGFVVAFEHPQRIAAVVDGLGIVRFDRDGAVEAFDRLVVALQRNQHAAAVVMGVGEAALAPDRLVEARQRLLVPFHRSENETMVEQHLRRIRAQLHRLGGEPQRRDKLAAAELDDAEHLQRIEMSRAAPPALPHRAAPLPRAAPGDAARSPVRQCAAHRAAFLAGATRSS